MHSILLCCLVGTKWKGQHGLERQVKSLLCVWSDDRFPNEHSSQMMKYMLVDMTHQAYPTIPMKIPMNRAVHWFLGRCALYFPSSQLVTRQFQMCILTLSIRIPKILAKPHRLTVQSISIKKGAAASGSLCINVDNTTTHSVIISSLYSVMTLWHEGHLWEVNASLIPDSSSTDNVESLSAMDNWPPSSIENDLPD